MPYEIKDNTFSLFANDKKTNNDKAPDYTGKGMFNGKEMRVAVWKQVSSSGVSYLSGRIEEPYKKEETTAEPKPATTVDLGDEILF